MSCIGKWEIFRIKQSSWPGHGVYQCAYNVSPQLGYENEPEITYRQSVFSGIFYRFCQEVTRRNSEFELDEDLG